MASVTRSTGKRGDVKRAAVADNLQAAMERLLEHGASFTQISVDALATEAGIARATFYLHFRDKGELVARLAARVTAEILEASTLRSPETVTRVELKKSVRAVLGIYHRHHAVLAAMVETSAYDADVAQLFRDMMERLIEVNRRTVLRLKQVGRLPADHPPQVAEVVTWAFERSGHQLIRGRSPAQLNAIAGALTHVIWNSIYTPTSD
jgi:AcrR family transcriptional regulator